MALVITVLPGCGRPSYHSAAGILRRLMSHWQRQRQQQQQQQLQNSRSNRAAQREPGTKVRTSIVHVDCVGVCSLRPSGGGGGGGGTVLQVDIFTSTNDDRQRCLPDAVSAPTSRREDSSTTRAFTTALISPDVTTVLYICSI